MQDKIIETLKTVFDPEIPVNIYDMGLIYKHDLDTDQVVHIEMTLTSPACPVAGTLPGEVQDRIRHIEGIKDCEVKLVWDPPWDPSKMTEAARLELNMF